MTSRSADRIESLVANHKIDIRPIRPERVVTRQPVVWTGLPPAVLSANYPISETGVKVPALERFPSHEFQRGLDRILATDAAAVWRHGPTEGQPRFRASAAAG